MKLESEASVPMSELQIGDRIQTGTHIVFPIPLFSGGLIHNNALNANNIVCSKYPL